MASTVLYMSMSLDGFITGPNVTADNGLGDGGERLHAWPFPGAEGGVNRQVYDEFMNRNRNRNRNRLANPAGPAMLSPERMFDVRTGMSIVEWLELVAAGGAPVRDGDSMGWRADGPA